MRCISALEFHLCKIAFGCLLKNSGHWKKQNDLLGIILLLLKWHDLSLISFFSNSVLRNLQPMYRLSHTLSVIIIIVIIMIIILPLYINWSQQTRILTFITNSICLFISAKWTILSNIIRTARTVNKRKSKIAILMHLLTSECHCTD